MSNLADALVQSMVSGFDPMNGVVQSVAAQHIAKSDIELDKAKIAMIRSLEDLITESIAATADASIIAAYRTMLAKYK